MNPLALYSQCIQTWVNTVEHAQANMLAFHQAVSSIQGYRARALGQWWQQAPHHLTAILTAPTPGDALAEITRWQGITAIQATHLATDTHAARAHLLKLWSRTFSTTTSASPPSTSTTHHQPSTTNHSSAPTSGSSSSSSSSKAKTTKGSDSDIPLAAAPQPKAQPQSPQQPAAVQSEPQPAPVATQPKAEAPSPAETAPPPTTPAQPDPKPTATIITLPTPQPAPTALTTTEGTTSATATTFARNTGHALNASAAPRRTASIPTRASRSRAR